MNTTEQKPASFVNVSALKQASEKLLAEKARADLANQAMQASHDELQRQIVAIQHPFNGWIREREVLHERLLVAERQLMDQRALAAELDASVLDLWIGLPNAYTGGTGGKLDFAHMHSSSGARHQSNAERGVELVSRWLKQKRDYLATLESNMLDYAAKHELAYLLPYDLKPAAQAVLPL